MSLNKWNDFVIQAQVIHSNVYDYPTPVESLKSTSKVDILCKTHGLFRASVNKHISARTGCPYCAKEERLNRNQNIRETNIASAIDKWQKQCPSYEYTKQDNNVVVTCQLHGSTTHNRISSTVNVYPCKQCGIKSRAQSQVMTNEDYISKALAVHDGLYQYHIINNVIHAECSTHGLFALNSNRRANHLNRLAGCPTCKLEYLSTSQRKDFSTFVSEATKLHSGKYTYPGSYTNTHTKIEISCSEHGSFFQTPLNHLQGAGCPACTASYAEQLFISTAQRLNIAYESQKKFPDLINPITKRHLRYDFFIPSINALIELDGRQHFFHTPLFHGDDESVFMDGKYRDDIKTMYAAENGYELYRVPYTSFKDIPTLLEELCHKQ